MLLKVGFSGFNLVSQCWVVPSRRLFTAGLEGGRAALGRRWGHPGSRASLACLQDSAGRQPDGWEP